MICLCVSRLYQLRLIDRQRCLRPSCGPPGGIAVEAGPGPGQGFRFAVPPVGGSFLGYGNQIAASRQGACGRRNHEAPCHRGGFGRHRWARGDHAYPAGQRAGAETSGSQ